MNAVNCAKVLWHACFVNENKICYLAFSYRSTEIKIKTFCRSDIFLGLSNIQAWTENRGSGELPSSCCENNCTCTLWTPMFSMNSLQADILRHCRRFCIARIRLFVPSYTHFIGRPFRFWVFQTKCALGFSWFNIQPSGIYTYSSPHCILWRVGAIWAACARPMLSRYASLEVYCASCAIAQRVCCAKQSASSVFPRLFNIVYCTYL